MYRLGIDIDIHAVEVAKFSLLIKLIENETEPSVRDTTPIPVSYTHIDVCKRQEQLF